MILINLRDNEDTPWFPPSMICDSPDPLFTGKWLITIADLYTKIHSQATRQLQIWDHILQLSIPLPPPILIAGIICVALMPFLHGQQIKDFSKV